MRRDEPELTRSSGIYDVNLVEDGGILTRSQAAHLRLNDARRDAVADIYSGCYHQRQQQEIAEAVVLEQHEQNRNGQGHPNPRASEEFHDAVHVEGVAAV